MLSGAASSVEEWMHFLVRRTSYAPLKPKSGLNGAPSVFCPGHLPRFVNTGHATEFRYRGRVARPERNVDWCEHT